MSLKNQKVLFKGAYILSMDKKIANLPVGDVLVEGKKIAAVAPYIVVENTKIIDATGMILMPGFTDSHRHSWQGALRRLMPDVSDLMSYVNEIHFGLAKYYRPQDIYIGNLLTAWSAIDHGITTIIDASHNTRSYDHANAAVDALEQSGIRALYAPALPLAGEWEQSFWTKGLELLQAKRFSSEGLIRLGIFTHMSTENWDIARRLGVPIITEFLGKDLSDTLKELQNKGLLGTDNIFNHCTGLTKEAWQIMSDFGVKVTVDPRSDAQYGLEEGVFAYQHAIEHGIKPGLGTDLETAYGGDMFTELRVAFSLQRAFAQNKKYKGEKNISQPVTSYEILESATIYGSEIAGFGNISGSITPGKSADFILIDTNAANIFPSNDAVGSVVHAADRSNVHTVMIAGRMVKSGGKLVGVNLEQLKQDAENSVAYLLKYRNT
ncbi:amidohydrolase family protein [Chryseobacterium bernardetii]|uniref:amidohydrolase family protein n=1 Tax=Chryseobacterium bernardetii TaxID=1241978 RepID=UPI0016246304|nr:amidohydrolase family protein [Chryseobacterium bernardetii]